MAKQSSFLKRMQHQHEQMEKTSVMLAEKWTRQAALDAVVLTLGYGECMGGDCWGAGRIDRFANEWASNLLEILRGAQGQPDSDAIRQKTDTLLRPKVLPEHYAEWQQRYPGWIAETLEEENARSRSQWKRDGMDTNAGVTGELLRDLREG